MNCNSQPGHIFIISSVALEFGESVSSPAFQLPTLRATVSASKADCSMTRPSLTFCMPSLFSHASANIIILPVTMKELLDCA